MTRKEALENITDWIEYFTRLDYVESIVRNEVQKKFYEAYHKTRPELELIEKDLEVLQILKKYLYCSGGFIKIKLLRKSIKNFDYESVKEWLENGSKD